MAAFIIFSTNYAFKTNKKLQKLVKVTLGEKKVNIDMAVTRLEDKHQDPSDHYSNL